MALKRIDNVGIVVDDLAAALRERDGVRVLAVQLLSLTVEIAVDVFRFDRFVVVHVRLRRAGTVGVVGAPLRVIDGRVPAIAGRPPVVFPLEERRNQLALGCGGRVLQYLLDLRIVSGRIKHAANPLIQRFLAWQRRDLLHDRRQLIEEEAGMTHLVPEAVTEVRHLKDDGFLVQIGKPEPVDDILIRAGHENAAQD